MTASAINITGRPSQLVASEIRAELARQGRSQRWLSGVLHHNQSWVSTRVSTTATVDLTVDEISEIAAALDVPVQTFLSTLVRSYLTAVAPVVDLDAYRAERAA